MIMCYVWTQPLQRSGHPHPGMPKQHQAAFERPDASPQYEERLIHIRRDSNRDPRKLACRQSTPSNVNLGHLCYKETQKGM